jgi:phosphatidylinositol-3-phosphatase
MPALLATLAALASLLLVAPAPAAAAPPPVKHVFTIVLENKDYEHTFGAASTAPYLAHDLTGKGVLLKQYHGTGHFSLGNYITMISGQSENPDTQGDCMFGFNDIAPGATGADGQVLGSGCVYPADVDTVADQLERAGYSWRGYMEDMGDDLARDATRRCAHPAIGATDMTQHAAANDQYATRHNPFVYFHSVIDDFASCKQHVVNLRRLSHNLRRIETTRNYSFITPDLCSDGHDEECANPSQAGGYAGIDAFLRKWVPKIMRSPAYKRDGLLIVTFDESESGAEACCFVPTGPNTPLQGIYGPGGGHTGSVLISPFIAPGTTSEQPYNHYDYLHTIEDLFGLGYLGYAARPEVTSFGADVFNR